MYIKPIRHKLRFQCCIASNNDTCRDKAFLSALV